MCPPTKIFHYFPGAGFGHLSNSTNSFVQKRGSLYLAAGSQYASPKARDKHQTFNFIPSKYIFTLDISGILQLFGDMQISTARLELTHGSHYGSVRKKHSANSLKTPDVCLVLRDARCANSHMILLFLPPIISCNWWDWLFGSTSGEHVKFPIHLFCWLPSHSDEPWGGETSQWWSLQHLL